MYRILCLFIPIMTLLITACSERVEVEEGPLVLAQAFTPMPAPGQKNAVAYFTLQNNSDKDLHILNVVTPIANVAEVHRHTYSEGVMQMRKVNHAKVPAKASLVFESGGYHLMLMGLTDVLEHGDQYPLTIEFDDGTLLNTNIPVKKR